MNGRDIPLLQDVDANSNSVSDVWYDLWQITYRDVIVLDSDNEVVEVYNLTTHDLANSTNYNFLRDTILTAANDVEVSPWQNPNNPVDVDGNGVVSPLDALLVINNLDTYPGGVLPALGSGQTPTFWLDTNGNGTISPLDALLVINALPSAAQASALPREALSFAASSGEPVTNNSIPVDQLRSDVQMNDDAFADLEDARLEVHALAQDVAGSVETAAELARHRAVKARDWTSRTATLFRRSVDNDDRPARIEEALVLFVAPGNQYRFHRS
jgi:hypothetical protein